MDIRTLSPSKLKQSRLCEARLWASLEDEEYEEEHGEGARAGILAHNAAMTWYRPNESWVAQMGAAMQQVQATIQRDRPADPAATWHRLVGEANQQLAQQGIVKHPRLPRLAGEG